LQIQKNYQLKSVENVLELLVNTHTINSLTKESIEFATEKDMKIRTKAS